MRLLRLSHYPLSGLLSLLLLSLAPACTSQPRQQTTHTNALADSRSPYLLQHANNPVNWYPWGEEALDKARKEDKMLIVSVGYAACHWCHVMERESFEDTAVARIMNEHFVSIKVDREERPDVDQIYMNAAYMTSGQGGWPLNAIALPDGRPVFAATYFPKEDWLKVLDNFIRVRREHPEQLETAAEQITQGIRQYDTGLKNEAKAVFAQADLDASYRSFMAKMDLEQGGLQGGQKFPMPAVHRFLLRYHALTGADSALLAVTRSLDAMRRGAIYDQLGGGFHRYTTDAAWRVPHFEKMLYDNAQLVSLYAQAYQLTSNEAYRTVVEETLGFVARELTSPEGAFYASLDADADGEEGAYYAWTEKDISKVAGHDAPAFKNYFNISPFGNWESTNANLLFRTEALEAVAGRYGYEPEALRRIVDHARGRLLEQRAKRTRPALDDKVLAAWSALMIEGYVDAYQALGDSSYLQAALKAAGFIEQQLARSDGGLYRSWHRGTAGTNAFADDYAYCIRAYVTLYQATFDETWLAEADRLMQYALAHFSDPANDMFFYTSDEDPALIARTHEVSDNVIPSANAVLAQDLFLLGTYLYRQDYLDRSIQMLNNVLLNIRDDGPFFAQWASNLVAWVVQPYEVAIVGPACERLRRELAARYLPEVLLLGGAAGGKLELLQNKLVPGETFIYVCRNKSCKLPVQTVEAALAQLR
ncbi:MAG: thioredoxin domain-containing protein [Bacteroidia bacterium]